MGLSIHEHSTQSYLVWLIKSIHLNKVARFSIFSIVKMTEGSKCLPSGHKSFTATVTEGGRVGEGAQNSLVLLVKRVHVDSLSNCELMIGKSRLFFQQQYVASALDTKKQPRSLSQHTGRLYVFLLFQFGSAAALGSTGRSGGERESWGDFWACGERGSSSGGGLSGWKGLL